MKAQKTFIIHPFLFALSPLVFLVAHNAGEILLTETLLPATVLLLLAATLYIALTTLLKNDLLKAGLTTSLIILYFYSYGNLYTCLHQTVRHRILLPASAAMVITFAILIMRTKRDLKAVTNLLNIAAASVVIISLGSIAAHHAQLMISSSGKANTASPDIKVFGKPRVTPLPDIYYIILDGYAAPQTTKEVFNYDNRHLLSFLKEKGFYIGQFSKTNYHMTFLSLASSLNMRYIDYSYKDRHVDNSLLGPFQLIRDNAIMRFLKTQGYTIILSGNWWGPTAANKYADIVFNRYRYVNEVVMTLINNSLLNIFYDSFRAYVTRKMVLNNFEALAKIPEIKKPTFTFVHIMAPHNPYVFGSHGEPKTVAMDSLSDPTVDKKHYFEQFLFVTAKIEETVETILQKSDQMPIIIIQSDHGWAFDIAFKRRVIERMRILNAYLLPAGGNALLYDRISPVNTFRIILNHYFGTRLALLEDRHYYSTRCYDYTDFLNYSDVPERDN